MIRLKDNYPNILKRDIFDAGAGFDIDQVFMQFERYAGLTLSSQKARGLLSLMHSTSTSEDPLWTLEDIKRGADGRIEQFIVRTYCVMGIIGMVSPKGDAEKQIQVEIGSRFDEGKNQFFFNYLLSRICDFSLTVEMITAGGNSYLNFLLSLFFVLKIAEASSVGLYREYVDVFENNMSFRGVFNPERDMQDNYPIPKGIAHTARDILFDNPINHLLLSAAKKIEQNYGFLWEVSHDALTFLNILKQETPTWRNLEMNRRFASSSIYRPLRHPYYAPYYEILRKLALLILHDDGLSLYEKNPEYELNGIVFNGADLWEEYIYLILRENHLAGILHPNNRSRYLPHYLYQGNGRPIYPDFISTDKKMIFDAKYKHLDGFQLDDKDRFQLISYLHTQNAKVGYLIFPTQLANSTVFPEGTLNGGGGEIGIYPLHISKNESLDAFLKDMIEEEDSLKRWVEKLYQRVSSI